MCTNHSRIGSAGPFLRCLDPCSRPPVRLTSLQVPIPPLTPTRHCFNTPSILSAVSSPDAGASEATILYLLPILLCRIVDCFDPGSAALHTFAVHLIFNHDGPASTARIGAAVCCPLMDYSLQAGKHCGLSTSLQWPRTGCRR